MQAGRAIARVTAGVGFGLLFLAGATAAAEGPAGVRAVYRADGVAAEPGDERWREIPEATLELSPQIIAPPVGGGSVTQAQVRAMHDGEWLALRLEWVDATADREVGSDVFRDAAAVGFPAVASTPPPSPFMGDAEHPVVIWQWSANLDAEARGQGEFAERYPQTPGLWYFPQDDEVRRRVQAWRTAEPVAELTATGWGTLRPRDQQEVQASSAHDEGRWSVVFRRPLEVGEGAARFRPGSTTQMVVALWNGSNGEVNGRKSVTLNWVPVLLDAMESDSRAER